MNPDVLAHFWDEPVAYVPNIATEAWNMSTHRDLATHSGRALSVDYVILILTIHAVFGVAAFGLVFPLTAAVSRFRGRDQKPRLGCCSEWLRQHQMLGFAGCAFALASLALVEVHKFRGSHSHLVTLHSRWGAAAILMAVLQVLSGLLRPANSAPPSEVRHYWRVGHTTTGMVVIIAGCTTSVLGLQKRMASGTPFLALFYCWLALLGTTWLIVEARRCMAVRREEVLQLNTGRRSSSTTCDAACLPHPSSSRARTMPVAVDPTCNAAL